ncbi:MAG: hypothetical protein WCG75_07975 [Armatimonadota bacterium]
MKNSRILFGIILLVLSMSLMGVLAMMKRKPNVYDHTQWDPVFEFIRTADKVETVATTYAALEYEKPPADIQKTLLKYDPTGHHMVQVVSKEKRAELVQLLKKMPDDQDSTSSCFCPHHYIRATKASQQIVISMCYFCDGMGVTGAIKVSTNMRKDTADEVSRVFGLDVFPFLGKQCYYNSGTFDPNLGSYGVKGPAGPTP